MLLCLRPGMSDLWPMQPRVARGVCRRVGDSRAEQARPVTKIWGMDPHWTHVATCIKTVVRWLVATGLLDFYVLLPFLHSVASQVWVPRSGPVYSQPFIKRLKAQALEKPVKHCLLKFWCVNDLDLTFSLALCRILRFG